ncbi:hypothetical protein DMENIID0001_001970 [Sergentomyia squamirostris]
MMCYIARRTTKSLRCTFGKEYSAEVKVLEAYPEFKQNFHTRLTQNDKGANIFIYYTLIKLPKRVSAKSNLIKRWKYNLPLLMEYSRTREDESKETPQDFEFMPVLPERSIHMKV